MPSVRLKIFVSSIQKEFQQIRKDLKSFLLGDAVLRRYISEVFLFENRDILETMGTLSAKMN